MGEAIKLNGFIFSQKLNIKESKSRIDLVYVVVKIFTRLNENRNQGQNKTLAGSMKLVIKKVVYSTHGSIFNEYCLFSLYLSNFERVDKAAF